MLSDAVRLEGPGRTAACWGRFGAATHRPAELPREVEIVAPWPWSVTAADLVWCDHAFGRPGAVELVEGLHAAMKPGALLAIVDVDEIASADVRTWLADTLDLAPAVGVVNALRRRFRPVHTSQLPQVPGWRSFVFLGRR